MQAAGSVIADLQSTRVWFEAIVDQIFLYDGESSVVREQVGLARHFRWIVWSRDDASRT